MIAEAEKFAFVVTHVEAEGKLLKIWAQTDEKLVQTIKTIFKTILNKIDQNKSNILRHNITSDTIYFTLGVNNELCRIKIYSLHQDDLALVKFIDYGNVNYHSIHNIYTLNNFPEAISLFSLPEAASVFILANVLPIGDFWLDEVVVKIRSILVNNSYYGVVQNVKNYKMLKFTMMNSNFSQILINRNMALPSSYSEQIMQEMMLPLTSIRTTQQTSNIPQDNRRIPLSQNIVATQKVVKSNSFKAIQLEIGSVHDVQISYVDEGPCKFSVQLIESISYLNSMMEKINSQTHLPLQEPPIAGQVCLGKQTHCNRLCRIVLNSPGDTSCKVYYADYGHHEVLPFSDIYQIPDEFVIPNIFSIRFTLSGIINWVVSDEMKDYFGSLVYNRQLKLRVCQGPMSPLIQYCDLFINGKNVKDTLSENFPDLCQSIYAEPKQLKIGTREIVFVSYVESTIQFFVQLESEAKLLEEVMNLIEQASKTASKLISAQIYLNMPCIALYEMDKNWYRASVVDIIDNDNIRVFYVDYGNQEVVSVNKIRAIPVELIKILPKQAIKCSLNGFQTGIVDKELVKNFESLVLEEKLNLIVLNNYHNTVIVDLFDKKNLSDPIKKDITEKLKSLENSKEQKIISNKFSETNLESSSKLFQVTNQKFELKTHSTLVQKQKSKNKNSKSRDNGIGNWEKEGGQGQCFKTNNNFESHETFKFKLRKDNENERFDNRYKRINIDYSNEVQNNQFDKDGSKSERFSQNNKYSRNNLNVSPGSKDYSNNERFSKTSNRNNNFESSECYALKTGKENRSNVSSRLDRHFGSDKSSDKESDTSSRSSGRRNNRIEKRINEDQRKYDGPFNKSNHSGRWYNEDRENDSYRKNDYCNINSKLKLSKDNHASIFNESRNVEGETIQKILVPSNKETSSYLTSTTIFKIPPPNITVGAVKNCTIVYYKDPSSFYVQLCPDNEDLNLIMDKIFTTLQNGGGKAMHTSEIKPGLQCIAQYSVDEQWYRAIVQTVKTQEVTVHFIDYGNIETVNFDKIKEIEIEFLKLPAQAIHCKLFCPSKSKWTKEESELFSNKADDKLLEAEFVIEENGIYHILVKEVISNNLDSAKYINDLFANGMNLIKEKEAMRNKTREVIKDEKFVQSNCASLDEKWLENKVELGTKYEVILTWFINPEKFYCQLINQQKKFREMMNEIQTTYIKRQPISEKLKIGSSVIAVLPEDGILYRAEIVELNKPQGHTVQYVDYGDRAIVDPRNIYTVDKKFMTLPRQAIFCSLKNIVPVSGSNWPNSIEMSQFFNVEKFDCIFHELKNCKYFISLKNTGIDISSTLIDKNLAVFSSIEIDESRKGNSIEKQEILKMDINLLEGQNLDVKVSNVESVAKFYVQFHTAKACQRKVDSFMATKNPEMLGLPVQLSVMQNQAIECALYNVPSSTKVDEIFEKIVTGKDVKIFVERVECNRLLVQLFDTNGNKIIVSEIQKTETISPICNMQILSSTHDVIVTWINTSNSIWLQRISEKPILNQLLQELSNYYSKVKECVKPRENQVYAALNNDGIWYRAKIMKIKDITCTVIFIDFGIIKDIPTENLRILENRFYAPHQLGIEVSLTVTLGGSEKAEKDILQSILMDKVLLATFYNVNRKWVTELTENGKKISEKLGSLNIIKQTINRKFEYVKLPEMLVGEKYEVIVSHVDSPNHLWVQRLEQVNNIIELQNQLQQVSSPLLDSGVVPTVKSLCLAMYSLNNQWYRAEVLDADTEITTVRFIDYGSTDVIDNSMSFIKQLPDKWKAINGYAILCKLDILPTTADDWSKEACIRFSELVLIQKPLQSLVIADKAPMRIDLFLDNQSICKMLVEEKLAIFLNCPEELEEEIIEEVELDPRSAFVSSIISVDTFWMQEDKYVNELEMMQDRLMMAPMLQPVTEIKEGLICIAHFPEDNYYYRATILSHNEDGMKVRYIDYGNSALTKDLRKIPEDLIEIQALSRKCCLLKPDGVEHWPQGINEEFTKLADEGSTIFLLDVVEEGETCLVKLMHDGKDVAIKLLELCMETNKLSKQENILETLTDKLEDQLSSLSKQNLSSLEVCTVCYANSPSQFWIHKKSHYLDLDTVMDELLMAEQYNIVTDIKEGQILAAKFDEDGQWYRSKVLSHNEKEIEVFYIDYGNTAINDFQSTLYELPENLKKIPPLATFCSLKMPENLENWSKAMCEKFTDLTEDVAIEYRFKILEKINHPNFGQSVQISLFYEDQDVVEILINHEKTLKIDDMNDKQTKKSEHKIFPSDNTVQTEMEEELLLESANTVSSFETDIRIESKQQELPDFTNITSNINTIIEVEIKNEPLKKLEDSMSASINNIKIEMEKPELQRQNEECNDIISSLDSNVETEANRIKPQKSVNGLSLTDNTGQIKVKQPYLQESKDIMPSSENIVKSDIENQEWKKSVSNICLSSNVDQIKIEENLQECINTISLLKNKVEQQQESKDMFCSLENNIKTEMHHQESPKSFNNITSNNNTDQIKIEQTLHECKNTISSLENEVEQQHSQDNKDIISTFENNINSEIDYEESQKSSSIISLSDNTDQTKIQQRLQECTNTISSLEIKVEQQHSQEYKDIISSLDNIEIEIQ